MHKVVIVCPPISKYCCSGSKTSLTFECQSQWIGLGCRNVKGDRVGLRILDLSENSTVKLLPLTLQLHVVDALVSSLTQ